MFVYLPMFTHLLFLVQYVLQLLFYNFPCFYSIFWQVALFYEDGRPVDAKGIGRKVLDRVHDTYDTELAGKDFAYDGEKSLFTIGALPRNKMEFTVVLEDMTSSRLVLKMAESNFPPSPYSSFWQSVYYFGVQKQWQ